MRTKAGFLQLSWLVFLAYLMLGLAGSVAACCSESERLSDCEPGEHADNSAFCLTSLDQGTPCLDHCQVSVEEQVHLGSRQQPPRLLPQLAPLPALPLRLQVQPVDTTGFLLAGQLLVQDSVLRALRSVILLI